MQVNWNEKSKKRVCGRQILNYLLSKGYDDLVPVGAYDIQSTEYVAVVCCKIKQQGQRTVKIKRESLLGLSVAGTPKENLAWREVSV